MCNLYSIKKIPDAIRRFAMDESRPFLGFTGIWTNWTHIRKTREGMVTADVFGFPTCEPNAEVSAVHPKTMLVILTAEDERETWLRAPWDEATMLQRKLPDSALQIVVRGERKDGQVKHGAGP